MSDTIEGSLSIYSKRIDADSLVVNQLLEAVSKRYESFFYREIIIFGWWLGKSIVTDKSDCVNSRRAATVTEFLINTFLYWQT